MLVMTSPAMQSCSAMLFSGAQRAQMPASRCQSGCVGSCAGTKTACRAVDSLGHDSWFCKLIFVAIMRCLEVRLPSLALKSVGQVDARHY
jgi:hypothetical protein